MAETEPGIASPEPQTQPNFRIATIVADVRRSIHSAFRSATQQDFIPELKSQYQTYEDALLKKVKDELTIAREHPAAATGVAITAALLLMRGPRRFLFRQTLGRFQSEESQFVKAENNITELGLSVDLMKKESRKLLERAALAERDMKNGHTALMVAGNDIKHLAKSVYKAEAQATNMMDFLREIPDKEALKLRAEVASVASILRQERMAIEKQIMKISEYGISV